MRTLKFVAAAFALALTACGAGQPRLYDVAIDRSSLLSLPTTCYKNGAPQNTVSTTGGFAQGQWNLWDGTDKQFLDVGQNTWGMGDANAVSTGTTSGSSLPSLIEGGPTAFTESRTFTDNSVSPANTDVRTVTVTFDATPGETATGTIAVQSTFTCSGCGQPSCQASLKFIARKIDTSQVTTLYQGR